MQLSHGIPAGYHIIFTQPDSGLSSFMYTGYRAVNLCLGTVAKNQNPNSPYNVFCSRYYDFKTKNWIEIASSKGKNLSGKAFIFYAIEHPECVSASSVVVAYETEEEAFEYFEKIKTIVNAQSRLTDALSKSIAFLQTSGGAQANYLDEFVCIAEFLRLKSQKNMSEALTSVEEDFFAKVKPFYDEYIAMMVMTHSLEKEYTLRELKKRK